jgi:uncharacterized delta-60 repeat protein
LRPPGTVVLNPAREEAVTGAALTPSGELAITGYTGADNGDPHTVVALLDANGNPDAAFGDGGKKSLDGTYGADVLAQPDGKLVVIGTTSGPDADFLLQRLGPDGTLDPSFGSSGKLKLNFSTVDFPTAGALLPDGRLLVVGAEARPGGRMLFARLHSDGSGDSAFGPNGQRTMPGSKDTEVKDVALQPDGAALVSGWLSYMDSQGFVLRLQGDPATGGGGDGGGGGSGGGSGGGDGGGSGGGGGGGGSGGGAKPTCGGKVATIVGTKRGDVLRGTKRADVIVGLGGGDVISGGRGNDRICGGTGNDRIDGGSGKDRLFGGKGKDKLKGGKGKDVCTGNAGKDRAAGCESKHSV